METWTLYWGHSCDSDRIATAWDASFYVGELLGEWNTETPEQAIAMAEADAGLIVRDYYVVPGTNDIHVLFHEA